MGVQFGYYLLLNIRNLMDFGDIFKLNKMIKMNLLLDLELEIIHIRSVWKNEKYRLINFLLTRKELISNRFKLLNISYQLCFGKKFI